MEKIKFVADTACDIPDDLLKEYDIDMPSVPITVDGEGYYERVSWSITEFFDVLNNAKEIPTTSRVPLDDYYTCYKKAWEEGFTHIVSVTINAGGSGTHISAVMARDRLYEKHPEAKGQCDIHVIDSKTYTMAYGYPVVEGAKMARDGKSVAEILDYIHDWVDSVEVYLGCYSLEYAKRSGRIGAAAAFVGDVLGLRPVILMVDGQTKTIDKVRGDKNLARTIYENYKKTRVGPEEPVFIARGEIDAPVEELQAMFKADLGHEVPVYYAGASILINAGPKIVAIVSKGKRRSGQ